MYPQLPVPDPPEDLLDLWVHGLKNPLFKTQLNQLSQILRLQLYQRKLNCLF